MEEKFDVLNELGEFTGEIATREECHQKGLWHRAVYASWNFLERILNNYID